MWIISERTSWYVNITIATRRNPKRGKIINPTALQRNNKSYKNSKSLWKNYYSLVIFFLPVQTSLAPPENKKTSLVVLFSFLPIETKLNKERTFTMYGTHILLLINTRVFSFFIEFFMFLFSVSPPTWNGGRRFTLRMPAITFRAQAENEI